MIAGISYYHIFQYFLIYSFLGWCTEVVYAAVSEGRVVNRGFLNGPVCPIYGFGILAVFGTINTGLSHFETGSPYSKLLLIFLCGMALTTMIELFGGWALDKLFHASWWDYSDKPFNFHGYICLQFSLLWGIGIVLVVEVVHPLIAAMGDRIMPERAGWTLMGILYTVYASDLMLSVMIMVGLNKRLAELDEMQKKMRVVSNTLSGGIGRSALGTAQYIGEAKVQAALAKAEAIDSLSAVKAEAVDSLSAVKAEAVDSLSTVATGAVDSLSAVKAGAVDGLSAVKNSAMDGISAVQSSGEKGLESLKKQYNRKTAALSRMVRGTRYFGAGRLLRAFPQMRHRKYRELLDKLKKDAEEGETR